MTPAAIRWTESAEKDIRRLDSVDQRRVARVVVRFAESGDGEVKRLQGQFGAEFRLRSGNLRIRFKVEPDGTLVILRVLPRDKAYR